VIEIRQTVAFGSWIGGLRDLRAAARIDARIGRLRLGNFGDVKSVGDGVSELRVDFGPGYRVYFTKHGDKVVVLLCAGDKGSQARDIKRAKAMAAELKG
jgi:putative addiction module killer protein